MENVDVTGTLLMNRHRHEKDSTQRIKITTHLNTRTGSCAGWSAPHDPKCRTEADLPDQKSAAHPRWISLQSHHAQGHIAPCLWCKRKIDRNKSDLLASGFGTNEVVRCAWHRNSVTNNEESHLWWWRCVRAGWYPRPKWPCNTALWLSPARTIARSWCGPTGACLWKQRNKWKHQKSQLEMGKVKVIAKCKSIMRVSHFYSL